MIKKKHPCKPSKHNILESSSSPRHLPSTRTCIPWCSGGCSFLEPSLTPAIAGTGAGRSASVWVCGPSSNYLLTIGKISYLLISLFLCIPLSTIKQNHKYNCQALYCSFTWNLVLAKASSRLKALMTLWALLFPTVLFHLLFHAFRMKKK